MQLHREPTTPDACAELKAKLSAYLDGELTREERIDADAHLIACAPCRGLVERAERLDESLRAQFAEDERAAGLGVGSDASAGFDDGIDADIATMQARVLASIGERRRRYWLPRLAVAAAIALMVGGAYALLSRDGAGPLAPAGVGEFARGDVGRSRAGAVGQPNPGAIRLASLEPDERQALYATSIILDSARRTAFDNSDRRRELVETIRYDELVSRLGDLMPKLSAEDRATVALARDVAARIATGGEDPGEWSRVREDVDFSRLNESVDELSEL